MITYELNNDRLISLLSNISKIINSRIVSYLKENKLLSKNQYGFRPEIRTEYALYNTT